MNAKDHIQLGTWQSPLDIHMTSRWTLTLLFNKEFPMQEFVIQSMSCGGCASRIAQAVKNLDAKARIEIDLPTKTVRIDSIEDRASFTTALTEAGYPPK